MSSRPSGRARRHDIPGDAFKANSFCEQHGWTDGLPVIPPTEELVAAMLGTTRCRPDEVLGRMDPLKGVVTVEKVAANAVMAGCYPECFPVVLASVRAVLQEQFHVGSTSCTTGGAAPALIVSGPIAAKVGINSGTGCFGGGFRANATIGRALRLTMRNLGGAKPGGEEKSTQAWPGKMTFCFAENEERSPWEPLRVEFGYSPDASTVTLVAVRGIHPIAEGTQSTGVGILETIAGAMRAIGSPIFTQGAKFDIPVVVALCPEHAGEIARAGFSKKDVKQFLFEHARLRVRDVAGRVYSGTDGWPAGVDMNDPDAQIPMVAAPHRFIVVVAGGDGRHSGWMPAWNVSQAATERVES